MSIKQRSLHRKKSVANKEAGKWRKKGFTAMVRKGKTKPGTSKTFGVKGWSVVTGRRNK